VNSRDQYVYNTSFGGASRSAFSSAPPSPHASGSAKLLSVLREREGRRQHEPQEQQRESSSASSCRSSNRSSNRSSSIIFTC